MTGRPEHSSAKGIRPRSTLGSTLIERFVEVVGARNIITAADLLLLWERDGSGARGVPDAVILPGSSAEVSAVVSIAAAAGIPLVARGAGTGLTGGAVTVRGGIALQLTRMRRILGVDAHARTALVEAGVANADLNAAANRFGLFYAPDPSSRRTCTIGGNAAENSGGPRSLRYGVTANHVVGMEVVIADGSVHWVGTGASEDVGVDLLGVLVGSEGTLAVITRLLVRLLELPGRVDTVAAAFESVDAANAVATGLLREGIVPAALELMDRTTVRAVDRKFRIGYPEAAGAVLMAELHGDVRGGLEVVEETALMLRRGGAQAVLRPRTTEESDSLWASRLGAISALSAIRPNFYLHDGVVPRSQLAEVLRLVEDIGRQYRIPIASVLHAGDGTLHPTLLFDALDPSAEAVVSEAADLIAMACIKAGGTLSGEHGVGADRQAAMRWQFEEEDLAAMRRVKQAFDPTGLLNPDKVLPVSTANPVAALPLPRIGATEGARWW
jgi:glycolate oxidase